MPQVRCSVVAQFDLRAVLASADDPAIELGDMSVTPGVEDHGTCPNPVLIGIGNLYKRELCFLLRGPGSRSATSMPRPW